MLNYCEDPTNLKVQSDTSDAQADLIVLLNEIYKLIDPSIRRYIQKRGITIINNVYSGFDSEYKLKNDGKSNNLISVQLATSTKVIIKLPLSPSYNLSTIHTQTNKVYKKRYKRMDEVDFDLEEKLDLESKLEAKANDKKNKKGFDFGKMEDLLRFLGYAIRLVKYPDYDYSMSKLIDGLKGEGLNSMSTDD